MIRWLDGERGRDGAVNPIGPQSGIITLTHSAIGTPNSHKCHVTDGTQALRIQSANQVQDQLVALSQPGAPAPYFDATNVEVVTDIGGLLG